MTWDLTKNLTEDLTEDLTAASFFVRASRQRTHTMTVMTIHDPTVPGTGVSFRRLVDEDLPLLHRWLNDSGVVRWWEGDDVSWEAVVRDYGSGPSDTAEHWIASVKGRDIGWIQCYPAADEPEETAKWWDLGVDRRAAGIDYLIGEPADRGRGLGSRMIASFVADVVFERHRDWTQAAAAPYAANVASWRALEKAGFRFAGIIEDRDGPCRLMVADRDSATRPGRAVMR